MRLPKHVTLNGTALRLIRKSLFNWPDKDIYYRDAGAWEVEFVVSGDKVISKSPHEHLNNKVMIPITWKEYKHDNRGYV